MPIDARIVSQTIAVPARTAYDYARQMDKLPEWASGLAAGIEQVEGRWYGRSPMGKVEVKMAPVNPHGVLDHDVVLPDGTTVHNALRISPCGDDGCMVVFVVLRSPGFDDAAYDKDVAHVQGDLKALKQVLEGRGKG